ncbi:MAG: flagellar biosynthetic protein FliO [Pseudomonadota bacterium]|nr:flagellar biosynthetic protein FliO [Pseudomonadota bacterium]
MDAIDPVRFILAFLFVVGLIGLLGFGLKRYGRMQKFLGAGDEGGRIAIIETRYLDPRRRLVLVRRDDAEHLLLLADGREMVIETCQKGKAGA